MKHTSAIRIINYVPHYIKYDVIEKIIWDHYVSKNQKTAAKTLHLSLAQLCENNNVAFRYSASVNGTSIKEKYRFGTRDTYVEFSLVTGKGEIKTIGVPVDKVLEARFPKQYENDFVQEGSSKITSKEIAEVVTFMVTRFLFKASDVNFSPRGDSRYLNEVEFEYIRQDNVMKFRVDTMKRMK